MGSHRGVCGKRKYVGFLSGLYWSDINTFNLTKVEVGSFEVLR